MLSATNLDPIEFSLERCICLYKDIRTEILSLMSDKDVNILLSTNKKMYVIKQVIIFKNVVDLKKIYMLNYFDSFIVVNVDYVAEYKFPKNIKVLWFDESFDGKIRPIGDVENSQSKSICIPSTVDFLVLKSKYLIYPGCIPESVKTLFLDIDQEITPGIVPNSVTNLNFYGKNLTIVLGSIPNSVKYLSFCYNFDQELLSGFIPESVEDLNLGYDFKKSLNRCFIPKSVKKLHLNRIFGKIPPWIEHLKFHYLFDEKLFPGLIPSSVTHIDFDLSFNQEIKVDVLPRTLTQLTFGIYFNQKILPGILPPTLTHLTFGNNYNQEILPDVLPDSIQYLTFGENFDKEIKCFPISLIYLKLGKNYCHKINAQLLILYICTPIIYPGDIPKSVTKLILSSDVKYLCTGSIPSTVTHLKVASPNINIFQFENNISDNLQILKIHPKIEIPNTIRKNIRIRYFRHNALIKLT